MCVYSWFSYEETKNKYDDDEMMNKKDNNGMDVRKCVEQKRHWDK